MFIFNFKNVCEQIMLDSTDKSRNNIGSYLWILVLRLKNITTLNKVFAFKKAVFPSLPLLNCYLNNIVVISEHTDLVVSLGANLWKYPAVLIGWFLKEQISDFRINA